MSNLHPIFERALAPFFKPAATRHVMQTKVVVFADALTEVDAADESTTGTLFPWGAAVRFPCDEHRRDYSLADALAVAAFVTQSSWIDRAGR